jgi:hypothetical protein
MLTPIYPRDKEQYIQLMQEAKAEYAQWELNRTSAGKSLKVFTRITTEDGDGFAEEV